MKKKKYRIVLVEEGFGCWRYEVWDGQVRVHSPEIGIPNDKFGVRKVAIQFAERLYDYGSHTVEELYQQV